MATQKPISTVSYNTEPFLKEKLDSWVSAHLIQAYQYIKHTGEDGDKDHIHLRVEPNKKLDPMDLSDSLKEYVQGEDKPRGVLSWRPSREEDWLLYAVHHPQYLAIKYSDDVHEKIPYDWKDIKCPDSYNIEAAFIRACASLKHSSVSLLQRLKDGDDAQTLVSEGASVFLINGVLRTLHYTDYERVSKERDLYASGFSQLASFLYSLGYQVDFDLDGSVHIQKLDS